MQRNRRQILKSGDEYDAICKYPVKVFDNNTGIRKKIKKKLNKRFRKSAKLKLRNI